ncbi:uncharacterized protein B0H18DRAFT_952327 [Fomitopsis serialis]|uniref:uncharacterized protein n=1 Tax=Fomitopsis serialis TaxID=139415 RepID=UPI002007EF39|nr:uncharacterized protein B0H18DRAFT_952327 [Neoantrodia serialis]KAH9932644.1 hypothetical protein B0H18DRAFT_952327 [Neoantrodia serialis]
MDVDNAPLPGAGFTQSSPLSTPAASPSAGFMQFDQDEQDEHEQDEHDQDEHDLDEGEGASAAGSSSAAGPSNPRKRKNSSALDEPPRRTMRKAPMVERFTFTKVSGGKATGKPTTSARNVKSGSKGKKGVVSNYGKLSNSLSNQSLPPARVNRPGWTVNGYARTGSNGRAARRCASATHSAHTPDDAREARAWPAVRRCTCPGAAPLAPAVAWAFTLIDEQQVSRSKDKQDVADDGSPGEQFIAWSDVEVGDTKATGTKAAKPSSKLSSSKPTSSKLSSSKPTLSKPSSSKPTSSKPTSSKPPSSKPPSSKPPSSKTTTSKAPEVEPQVNEEEAGREASHVLSDA